ncbi:MAG: hypothetical protein KF746_15960 [Chitinophagaceae bacterium]|nr:hypothetical protein [Chitinophagaceae bacterium]
MVKIGRFFFRYRNFIFILFYAMLFVPSPPVFSRETLGENYHYFPIICGLLITVTGQLIRGGTIGLAYILRGGKDRKPYADGLVTEGIFRHCRNPLYAGNILMLLGVGILANSLLYVAVMIPMFMFIYQAIVLAEEDFLRGKFGAGFDEYCRRVNRWLPNFKGLSKTFESMRFNWKRWLLKEYNTQFVWLCGITLILLLLYPQLTGHNAIMRNSLLMIILPVLFILYLLVRYLKKSGKLAE